MQSLIGKSVVARKEALTWVAYGGAQLSDAAMAVGVSPSVIYRNSQEYSWEAGIVEEENAAESKWLVKFEDGSVRWLGNSEIALSLQTSQAMQDELVSDSLMDI